MTAQRGSLAALSRTVPSYFYPVESTAPAAASAPLLEKASISRGKAAEPISFGEKKLKTMGFRGKASRNNAFLEEKPPKTIRFYWKSHPKPMVLTSFQLLRGYREQSLLAVELVSGALMRAGVPSERIRHLDVCDGTRENPIELIQGASGP